MVDFKFSYLSREGPWALSDIGLAEDGAEDEFYTLATGHAPDVIDFSENAIMFSKHIDVDRNTMSSAEEYRDYLQLYNIDLDSNHDELLIATDSQMAETLNKPSIWTESVGESVEITIDDEPLIVPNAFRIYELIPLESPVHTMTTLKDALRELTGEDDIWITIS